MCVFVANCYDMCMKKVTKTTKKTKVIAETKPMTKEEVAEKYPSGYNEYRVCISCQGGDPSCHHNNLVQDGQKLSCALCGKDMKCV